MTDQYRRAVMPPTAVCQQCGNRFTPREDGDILCVLCELDEEDQAAIDGLMGG